MTASTSTPSTTTPPSTPSPSAPTGAVFLVPAPDTWPDALPGRYWLCAATGPTIKIWDLESKNMVEELRPEVPGTARADPPQCLSLAWSADGQTLFAGYSDNLIRVWQVGTRIFMVMRIFVRSSPQVSVAGTR